MPTEASAPLQGFSLFSTFPPSPSVTLDSVGPPASSQFLLSRNLSSPPRCLQPPSCYVLDLLPRLSPHELGGGGECRCVLSLPGSEWHTVSAASPQQIEFCSKNAFMSPICL